MSNIATTTAKITLSNMELFPWGLQALHEDNKNLVDTETIPNYAGVERNRFFFSTTELVKPNNRRIRGLVAIPFGIVDISADQLND